MTDSMAYGAGDDSAHGAGDGRARGAGDGSAHGAPAPGRRRLVLRLLAVAAVVGVVVVAAGTADRATVDDVLSIPRYGTVRAELLGNGTPVFVVAQPGEDPEGPPQVDVMQAFTTELDHPVTGLVGWCADAGQFIDAHHGPLFDVRGRRLPSSVTGRELPGRLLGRHTALDDLIHRTVDTAEGRLAAGDPLVVGGVQGLQPWQVEERPALDPDVPPAQCRLPDEPLLPDDEPAGLFRRVVDHSFYARPVDPDTTGWQVTDGWLVLRPDGTGSWCDDEPVGTPPSCAAPREDVTVDLALTGAEVGPVPVVIGGPLAVRLREGAVVRAAVLADTAWRGSSLRGTWTHTGLLVHAATTAEPTLGLRDLQPLPGQTAPSRSLEGPDPIAPETPERCPGTWTLRATPTGTATAVPVDRWTAVDLKGVTSLSGVDQLDGVGGDGVPVRIVVDAVTCAALSITDAS